MVGLQGEIRPPTTVEDGPSSIGPTCKDGPSSIEPRCKDCFSIDPKCKDGSSIEPGCKDRPSSIEPICNMVPPPLKPNAKTPVRSLDLVRTTSVHIPHIDFPSYAYFFLESNLMDT